MQTAVEEPFVVAADSNNFEEEDVLVGVHNRVAAAAGMVEASPVTEAHHWMDVVLHLQQQTVYP